MHFSDAHFSSMKGFSAATHSSTHSNAPWDANADEKILLMRAIIYLYFLYYQIKIESNGINS